MLLLSYILLGMFAGVTAGLLGVGGGLIIVPVLALLLRGQGVGEDLVMHLAVGTSLATIAFTSLSSGYAHHRRGGVSWSVFARLAPGIVVGAGLGAVAAALLPAHGLRAVFGLFELAVAAQLAFGRPPAPHRQLPGPIATGFVGTAIGAVSALLGIGGGSLTVPYLVWCNVPIRTAVGTSAACGLPIALAGAAGFVITGWNAAGLPPGASGFVVWPAVAGVAIASVAFAPLGAWIAHRVPTVALRRGFALFLVALAVKVLWG
ncbi:MAG: sulfite exporter TauE/SafE family protein [Gammaproteobacteria bacterium]